MLSPNCLILTIRLRQSQYPFAVEHYRLRFNKTKRRRPRIPPALPNQAVPLDTKGWSVRTNFKLAAYSEYKQELDVAIKFYEIAYNELMDLFSSTAMLPPRSQRWRESRVLADSIAYKVPPLFYLADASYVNCYCIWGNILVLFRRLIHTIKGCRCCVMDGVLELRLRNIGIGCREIIVCLPIYWIFRKRLLWEKMKSRIL